MPAEAAITPLVVSADVVYYLPDVDAVERDRESLDRVLVLDRHRQHDQYNRSCGHCPVGVPLVLARKQVWQVLLLQCSDVSDSMKIWVLLLVLSVHS